MFKIDEFIEIQTPQTAKILIELRHLIISSHPKMIETWKYKTPFYVYKGMFCYLSVDKKTNRVYVGFCDGYLMAKEIESPDIEDSKMIKKIFVNEKTIKSNMETLRFLLQEAIYIKDTIQPKFVSPAKIQKIKPS